MSMYHGDPWQVSFKHETTVRNGDAIVTSPQSWGIWRNFTPPEFGRNYEKVRSKGARNPTNHIELGFELQDISLEQDAQVGILWYYALGACTSTDTGDGWQHDITEASAQPTFAIHAELENEVDAQSIREDYLGCTVQSLTMRVEKGGGAKWTGTINAMKFLDTATDIAAPADLVDQVYTWDLGNNASLSWTYNSTDVVPDLGDYLTVVEISVDNTYDVDPPVGDEFPKTIKWTGREYTVNLTLNPTTKTARGLLRDRLAEYATDLAFVFRLQRSATDYIEWTFNNLRIMSGTGEFPEQGNYAEDISMELGESATVTVTALDGYANTYYEGS